ncbi:MAG: hypothetical protein AB7E59_06635 [Pusillimonas sp.]
MYSTIAMRFKVGVAAFAAAGSLFAAPVSADEIKVGLLSQYSGTYS